jgi:hypothetical protein
VLLVLFTHSSTLIPYSDKTRCDVVLKLYLRLALASLVLLQLFVVAVDTHQLHQPDEQHQLAVDHLDHGHETGNYEVNNHDANSYLATSVANASASDCQHCCHCHSSMGSILPAAIAPLAPYKPYFIAPDYSHPFQAKISASLYRPPIV